MRHDCGRSGDWAAVLVGGRACGRVEDRVGVVWGRAHPRVAPPRVISVGPRRSWSTCTCSLALFSILRPGHTVTLSCPQHVRVL